MYKPSRLAPAALIAASLLAFSGCSDSSSTTTENKDASTSASSSASSDATLDVYAAAYPIAYLAKEIGGDRVKVTDLTESSPEPHEAELTPKQVAAVVKSDAFFFLSGGFQAHIEEAAEGDAKKVAHDMKEAANLVPFKEDDHDEDHKDEHGHDDHDEEHKDEDGHEDEHGHDEEHKDEHGEDEHGHNRGTHDPHFWHDPKRMSAVADDIAKTLIATDADGKADYEAGLKKVKEELNSIDREFASTIKGCSSKDLVTTHDAFGYLSRAYGLHAHGIAGLSPSDEPSPKKLKELADLVKDNNVKTIFFESTATDSVAKTLADETGAKSATLLPLGVKPESGDFASAMRENLKSLSEGLGCSK